MSLAATTIFEVRETGNNNNGGGFNPARVGAGTDYSQQVAPQFNGVDLAVDAVTTTLVTSASHSFGPADVGNLINISAGLTVGVYEILSVNAGAATLDRAAGTAGSTGGTWALGGAYALPSKLGAVMVNSSTAWIKAPNAAYLDAGQLILLSGATIRAYTNTRGDNVRQCVIQANGLAGAQLSCSGVGYLAGFIFDGNHTAAQSSGAAGVYIHRCKFLNTTASGIGGTAIALTECEAYGNATYGFNPSSTSVLIRDMAHHNNGGGFNFSSNSYASHCLAYANAGATSDGFNVAGAGSNRLDHCDAYGNGRNGFNIGTGGGALNNCIAVSNTGYGFGINGASTVGTLQECCGFGNGSGNVQAGIGIVAWITITNDPFVNAAAGNFQLNTGAGAGQVLRSYGASWPAGSATASYADMGAVQHPDTVGGPVGSSIVIPGRKTP